MPLFVVENRAFGNRAYCAINEGLGKVMRFGGNDASVLARLAWLRDVFGPALGKAIRAAGGIDLKAIIARGLSMGDEMHQRNLACSSVFLREIAPCAGADLDRQRRARRVPRVHRAERSVLPQHRDGDGQGDDRSGATAFAVRRSSPRCAATEPISASASAALGDRWFTAPVEMPEGLYFPRLFARRTPIRTWAIPPSSRPIGLGGFAMAAAPAVAGFIGAGAPSEAAIFTRAMGEITRRRRIRNGRSPRWTSPACRPASTCGWWSRPALTPVINTGIAHASPASARSAPVWCKAPLACFQQAVRRHRRAIWGCHEAVVLNEVRKGFYLDSVALMRLSREVAVGAGRHRSRADDGNAVQRGDHAQCRACSDEGAARQGQRSDHRGQGGKRAAAARSARRGSASRSISPRRSATAQRHGVRTASPRPCKPKPEANLALISVPGDFAAAEARKALNRGLHVLMFSDNVPLAEELSLKQQAREAGLLMMGPDCGTAIIGGAPLAFANRVSAAISESSARPAPARRKCRA